MLKLILASVILTVTNALNVIDFLSVFGGQPISQELERLTNADRGFYLENSENPTPVVLWHGMGDDCCHAFSMGAIKKLIETQIPGVHVVSLCIGNNPDDTSQCNQVTDTLNGFLSDVNSDIDYACKVIKNDPLLNNGYHAVGFSQGGLFSRVLAQRCDGPTMKSLVSIGGPQQGVNNFPNCPTEGPVEICEYVSKLLDVGAYVPQIQSRVVQAQYWHDPLHPETYKTKNIFLPDANQENGVDEVEVGRIRALEAMVLVKFTKDTMVLPAESEWFGFFEDGSLEKVVPAKKLAVWKNLGLEYLNEQGRLHFLSTVGDHLQFTDEWFVENIVPFLTG